MSKKESMGEIGNGICAFTDEDAATMQCSPKSIDMGVLAAMFPDVVKAAVVRQVVLLSEGKFEWRGAVWPILQARIYEDILRGGKLPDDIIGHVNIALGDLIKDGYLVVREPLTKWRFIFNRPTRNIFCPTPKLVRMMLELRGPM